jgi:hypothetical protein
VTSITVRGEKLAVAQSLSQTASIWLDEASGSPVPLNVDAFNGGKRGMLANLAGRTNLSVSHRFQAEN